MAFDTSPYDLMKKSRNQEALNKKNNTISALDTQKGGIENTYKDLADTLAKRKADLSAKNVVDNQNYDTQLVQGNEKFMNQRDQGVIANTNNSKAVMDWYAKNNIANSTASADEMGRQATTLANTLGTINSNKNQFDTGIANDRNLTNINYNNGVNDLTNQDNAAQREKAQKIAEILNQITNADNTYNSELQSINDSVEAQRVQAEDAYNERLRQEAVQAQQAAIQRQFQAQQAARSAASRSSGLSNTMSSGSSYNKAVADINDVVNGSYNLSEKQRVLQRYIDDLSSQQGNEAVALNKYAQDALGKVNQQMSNFVNSGRYAGYENRRM